MFATIVNFSLMPKSTNRLWLSRSGQPLSENGLYRLVCKRTREAFGKRVNPHLFRSCLATSTAVHHGAHMGLAMPCFVIRIRKTLKSITTGQNDRRRARLSGDAAWVMRRTEEKEAITRAVVYARYSSDPIAEGRLDRGSGPAMPSPDRAEGWRARGGTTLIMLSAAPPLFARVTRGCSRMPAVGRFEILVAEALDRLSRDQENIAGLFKQLSFASVRLITLVRGRSRRITCRPQGHHERPIPEGPRPKNPARPGRPRASGQVGRRPLLRL